MREKKNFEVRGTGYKFKRTFASISIFLAPACALAQVPPPDAGRILQDTQPQPQRAPAPALPPIQAPAQPRAPAPPAGSGDVRVKVTHFVFSGNSALSSEELSLAVAEWAGRALSFGDLIQAVEAVEARYKAAGYFLAQGILPPQKIRDGAIEIAISEGRMGEGRLEGESRVSPDVVHGYLDPLTKGTPLALSVLERQVLLINELAGVRATLDLQAGDAEGSTDVVLALQPDAAVNGRLDANNHGTPATGEKRFSLNLTGNSLLNLGERITATALGTDTGKLTSYNFRGELPVGGNGWRLSAAASRAEYSLGGAFSALQASGQADSWRVGAAYPFIRGRNANLKLTVEADTTRLSDKFRAANTETDKKSRGLTATTSGDWLDDLMGGGVSRIDLALRAGRLSLDPTSAAQDARPAGLGAAGSFTKVTLSAQRQQTLGQTLSLQAQLTWQVAGKNPDSSEKLSLGGPLTMPGYANGEAIGDSGKLLKLSLRWQASPDLALSAFTDAASLRLAHEPLPTAARNSKRLSDVGIGADWVIGKGFNANAILAWAGKEAPNPAENDKPRFWLSAGYAW